MGLDRCVLSSLAGLVNLLREDGVISYHRAGNEIARDRISHGMRTSAFPIPKGLCLPAQGCEERATLGRRVPILPIPTGLCHTGRARCNPVGVDAISTSFPKAASASQPWALGRNPFGIFCFATALG